MHVQRRLNFVPLSVATRENIILFSGWVPIGVHTCMHHVGSIPVSFSADNLHSRIDVNLQISQIRPKAEEDWSHVFFDYGSTIHRPFLYFHFDMII